MYLKYKHMQIVKHALQHYIQREGADEHDLMVERNLLDKVKKILKILRKM